MATAFGVTFICGTYSAASTSRGDAVEPGVQLGDTARAGAVEACLDGGAAAGAGDGQRSASEIHGSSEADEAGRTVRGCTGGIAHPRAGRAGSAAGTLAAARHTDRWRTSAINAGMVILRFALGIVMIAHGYNHIWGGGKIAGTAALVRVARDEAGHPARVAGQHHRARLRR